MGASGTEPIRSFRTYIAHYVPGCPYLLIDRETIKVSREICRLTRLWKEAKEVASLRNKVNQIEIGPYPEADIVSVEYVTYNGVELIQTSERELSEYFPRWRDTQGTPTHFFTIMRDGVVQLYPSPSMTMPRSIQYEVIVQPSLNAETVPWFLYDQFIDVITDGVLYGLMGIVGKAWSNPMESVRRGGMYQAGIYRARDLAVRMYASQNINTIPDCIY